MSDHPPIDHPLVEKLRHLQTYSFPYNGNYYVIWDQMLKICREHFAEEASNNTQSEVVSSEIPVNRELLRAAIFHDIEGDTTGAGYPISTIAIGNAADSIMGTIEPFLAKHKPVMSKPVSLKMCVSIFDAAYYQEQKEYLATAEIKRIVSAILDAAGISYVD